MFHVFGPLECTTTVSRSTHDTNTENGQIPTTHTRDTLIPPGHAGTGLVLQNGVIETRGWSVPRIKNGFWICENVGSRSVSGIGGKQTRPDYRNRVCDFVRSLSVCVGAVLVSVFEFGADSATGRLVNSGDWFAIWCLNL